MAGPRNFHMVPIGGIAMVPLAALLREAGHRVTGSDGPLYPPMSTLLERLGIPVAQGIRRGPRPVGLRRRHRRQRRDARQPRGRRGHPPGPACPLDATGDPRVPAARQDLGRRDRDAREDDDLRADRLAPARFRPRPGIPRRRRDDQRGPRVPAGGGPRFRSRRGRIQRVLLRPRTQVSPLRPAASLRRQHRVRSRRPVRRPRGGHGSVPGGRAPRPAGRADRRQRRGRPGPRRAPRSPRARSSGSRPRIPAPRSRRATSRFPRTARASRLLEEGREAGRLHSPMVGMHNLRNALGAIALARGLGLARRARSPGPSRASPESAAASR